MPEIYKKTYKFLEPKDFLNLKLTGQFASSFDTMTLHWITNNRNIDSIHYDKELLDLAKVEQEKFPKLKYATDILGPLSSECAEELGLSPDIQVIVGSPDLQSASIGSGSVDDFKAHLCIGTSSWLTCHVPYKKTDLIHNMATLPSALKGRYFVANEQESAGICLEYLQKLFSGIHQNKPNSFEDLNALALKAPPLSRQIIFTPWINGERTPIEDHSIRGGFHNLSLQSEPEDLVRSVYEGVAYNSKWLLDSVENFVGKKLDDIHIIGGGANSDIWCQIHADVLNRNMVQIKDPRHANARGAAWLGAIALGYMKPTEIKKLIQIKKIYTPNIINVKLYANQFKEFINLYHSNKKIHRRLNMT